MTTPTPAQIDQALLYLAAQAKEEAAREAVYHCPKGGTHSFTYTRVAPMEGVYRCSNCSTVYSKHELRRLTQELPR